MFAYSGHLTPHICRPDRPCNVPPHPGLIDELYLRYKELLDHKRLPPETTFEEFFNFWASTRRGENLPGMDDGIVGEAPSSSPQLISRPAQLLQGDIPTIVLLVDFDDCPAQTHSTVGRYERMLFGEGNAFPSGSMREYFRTISNYDEATNSGIDVSGEVYGWFRMPQPMSYYSNGGSGTLDTYPRNCQGLARDAVAAAVKEGVLFENFDPLGENQLTALFVIHSGQGAEVTGLRSDIWSHKWQIPGNGAETGVDGLRAVTYLTVPEDCKVGVCAHEWGHLAARWADYYDTDSRNTSNGLGEFCLMASGSWANGGLTPTFPNGMLRMFHNWIGVQTVDTSQSDIVLNPASKGGGIVLIQNPQTMDPDQYIVVEYRQRTGQDRYLPDEGIAVYVVDERIDNVNDEDNLAIELLQADGKRQLQRFGSFGNQGDANDLYPSGNRRTIGKTTRPALNLPNGDFSGVTIRVKGRAGDPTMSIDVKM